MSLSQQKIIGIFCVFILVILGIRNSLQLVTLHHKENGFLKNIELQELNQANDQQRKQKRAVRKNKRLQDDEAMISSLTKDAELNGLWVRSIKTIEDYSESASHLRIVHLNIFGGLAQFSAFFDALSQYHPNDFVTQLSLMATKNGEMKISLNLVCLRVSESYLKKETSVNRLSLFSLNQLQFVGYLEQQGRVIGVIRLPSGVCSTVKVGDSIGIESARVLSVTQSNLLVQEKSTLIHLMLQEMLDDATINVQKNNPRDGVE